ncbi:MAG: TolC family protein [Verrucomicrobia subdivision 3 bacterium]|nr:TolC family protein [Limisphaerales bacterium]
MKRILVLSIGLAGALASAEPALTNDALTLDQAIALAERLHPELAEGEALLRAAQGRADQAGRLPNPRIIARTESVPTSGGATREAEYLAGFSQSFQFGGRLSKARSAERLAGETRLQELEMRRRDIRKRVHAAFATALYQEKAFLTLSNISRTFEQSATVIKARVDAGDALPEDLARIELELIRSKIERDRGSSMRQTALTQLAAAIGDPKTLITRLDGNLDVTFEIPTLESTAADLAEHPAALRAEADNKARAARLELAKAQRIPEVTFEALYRRLEGERRNTFDVGVSIPLPLFDRNVGNVREARAESAAAEARYRATQNELRSRAEESHLRLTAALGRRRALRDDVLPRARTVLETAELRYSAGDIRVSELLGVRRAWASLELDYLESLRDVAQAWADVQSLMAPSQ